MKWKASSLAPALLCAGVTASMCLFEILGTTHPDFSLFNRLEWITYDWRVREAARHSPPVAPNLGFVAMDDESIDTLLNGTLPYRFGLLWPRQVYGRLVDELSAQGAKAVGFDVLFSELRPDHPDVVIAGQRIPSDEFFARSLQRNRNVLLASEGRLFPPPAFATNALAVAHISAQREVDGILRRTHAFVDVRVWHPVLKEAAQAFGWNLDRAAIESRELRFPRQDDSRSDTLPLDAEGRFNVGLLERAIAGNNTQPIVPRFDAPFEDKRVWQLGIALAAHQLNFNLDQAVIDLAGGRIALTNAQGVRRIIPVDRAGRFYINWSVPLNDPRLMQQPIQHLLAQHEARQAGHLDATNEWAGKLIVVGSTATGNNLSDHGATPLEQHTFLVSDYWNVANSVLMNHFVRPLDLRWRLLLIAALGALAGLCTLKLKTLTALAAVALIGAAYGGAATWLFISSRLWLPIVLPVGGALLCTHVCLITYLVRVERRGRRRIEGVFSKVVSPAVVQELLGQEKLSFGGARRRVTVFFADVRGFTDVTNRSQQRAEEFVARQKLDGESAARYFDQEAQALLRTVNPYLGVVADLVKKHGGTLDKYIGDCVMAFWGAPISNQQHAVCCVRAAIDAQRAVFKLNQRRLRENERRTIENLRRDPAGGEPLPPLEILTLGSGINTGIATVGMVGSEEHFLNYTVFGREVNLASRLEGASGSARILISEQTYTDLLQADPALAATCLPQPPLSLKGFRDAVTAYEVPWLPSDVAPSAAGQTDIIVRRQEMWDASY